MKLVEIYQCLCDQTRVRIIALLARRSLCVCHIQNILGETQVKVSKHLAYLKERGLVEVQREANWRIYRLSPYPSKLLRANLDALRSCEADEPILGRDAVRLRKLGDQIDDNGPICTPKPNRSSARAS
jgi:DNA-binding transcriptional ArsR family regulator